MTITVMDVFRELGVNPDRSTSWSVGAQVASMFKNHTGRQPVKQNRPETSGAGTHCFATYPERWRVRIASVIRQHAVENERQFSLF